MKIRPDTRTGRVLLALAGLLIRSLTTALGWTWRYRFAGESAERLRALQSGHDPLVLALWHNRLTIAAPFLRDSVHRAGLPVSLLISASGDGELLARVVKGWDVDVVRGSANRGGARALLGAYRALERRGTSPVVVPDGPTGPVYRYKPGALHLARLSGRPIQYVGLAADRYWTVRSWDRLMIPRPFARVGVALPPPRPVPRELDGPALEDERRLHEGLLNRATLDAEQAVGATPPPEVPVPHPPAALAAE